MAGAADEVLLEEIKEYKVTIHTPDLFGFFFKLKFTRIILVKDFISMKFVSVNRQIM